MFWSGRFGALHCIGSPAAQTKPVDLTVFFCKATASRGQAPVWPSRVGQFCAQGWERNAILSELHQRWVCAFRFPLFVCCCLHFEHQIALAFFNKKHMDECADAFSAVAVTLPNACDWMKHKMTDPSHPLLMGTVPKTSHLL